MDHPSAWLEGWQRGPIRVCAILTCHDRRNTTLACLRSLEVSARHDAQGVELQAILLDDGSSDGTADAVRAAFAWVTVLHGDGSAFWCRGMHRAMAYAIAQGHDVYLWLNDDTLLQADAVPRLLDDLLRLRTRHGPALLLIGSTVDAATGKTTYGGSRRTSKWRPLRFAAVAPSAQAQRCEAMAGNIVLIPAATAECLGNLEPRFEHAMGDTDYALRAHRAGIGVWLAPGVHGTCSDNARDGTYHDRRLPLAARWRRMMSRKGLPWRSWLLLAWRHGGPLWPLHFASPYVKVVVTGSVDALSRFLGARLRERSQ